MEVRRSLEELAIELACQRMSDSDIEDLELAQNAFREAVTAGDAMTIAETDEHYHDIIYNGTGNNRLVQILNNPAGADVPLSPGIHQGCRKTSDPCSRA